MAQALEARAEPIAAQEATIFSNRGKLLVALVVLVGALGYLGYLAFDSATVYYYTVGEANELSGLAEGKSVRVGGKLVPDSFSRAEGSTLAYFELTDGDDTMLAFHDGVFPDLFFNEHSEIILEGAPTPDGAFESHNIIVSCPSKYEAADS